MAGKRGGSGLCQPRLGPAEVVCLGRLRELWSCCPLGGYIRTPFLPSRSSWNHKNSYHSTYSDLTISKNNQTININNTFNTIKMSTVAPQIIFDNSQIRKSSPRTQTIRTMRMRIATNIFLKVDSRLPAPQSSPANQATSLLNKAPDEALSLTQMAITILTRSTHKIGL